jgi:hypothetical protein
MARVKRRPTTASPWPAARALLCAAAALGAFGGFAPAVSAYETDQYSNRLLPIRDSEAPLDAMVNEALAKVVEEWHGPRDDYRLARKIYWILGGLYWVDHIERRAMSDPAIEKLPQEGRRSVYSGAPFAATRVNFFFGIGRTIKVSGVLIGTDKLGHFFSQGVKYFGSHERGESEQSVLGRGRFNERWLFGELTTSVYSNADLVANYEGYRFYRSLFEDGVVPGKPAIVGWRKSGPFLQRAFTFADHVNDYWDEALNPSYVERSLQRWFDRRLPELCDDFRKAPQAYVSLESTLLDEEYSALGIKPASQNRMDEVCRRADTPVTAAGTTPTRRGGRGASRR